MAISALFCFGRRKTNDSRSLPRAVIEQYTQERQQLTKSYYNGVLGLRRTKLISVRCQQICTAKQQSCQCTGSVLKQVCQIKHLNEEFKQKSWNQIQLSRKEWNWGRERGEWESNFSLITTEVRMGEAVHAEMVSARSNEIGRVAADEGFAFLVDASCLQLTHWLKTSYRL